MTSSGRKGCYKRRTQKKYLSLLQSCGDRVDRPFCCLSSYEHPTKFDVLMHATWPENMSESSQVLFIKKFARNKTDGGNFIYLRDIKDYVLFNVMNDISPTFVEFFWTLAVDRFLRALIIYFQFYLQVWDLVQYRTKNKHRLFRHRNSLIRERKWRQGLNDLRYIVAREYFAILDGQDDSAPFHHMGRFRQRIKSSVKVDKLLYELLHRYARRVVEVALGKSKHPAIYDEMARLFLLSEIYRFKNFRNGISDVDLQCLEDPIRIRVITVNAPIARELYRSNRKPALKILGHGPYNILKTKDQQTKLLQIMYLCSESCLEACNLRVGILGLQRTAFDVTFNPIPGALKITSLEKMCAESKETITPPLYEDQPQGGELSNLVYCDYKKKDIINKWKQNLAPNKRIFKQ